VHTVKRPSGRLGVTSAVAALDGGVTAIASADRDFERIEHVRVFRPSDLGPLTNPERALSRVAA
jgi:hypothetical protein